MQWCWLRKLEQWAKLPCGLLSVGCEEEVRPLPSPGAGARFWWGREGGGESLYLQKHQLTFVFLTHPGFLGPTAMPSQPRPPVPALRGEDGVRLHLQRGSPAGGLAHTRGADQKVTAETLTHAHHPPSCSITEMTRLSLSHPKPWREISRSRSDHLEGPSTQRLLWLVCSHPQTSVPTYVPGRPCPSPPRKTPSHSSVFVGYWGPPNVASLTLWFLLLGQMLQESRALSVSPLLGPSPQHRPGASSAGVCTGLADPVVDG